MELKQQKNSIEQNSESPFHTAIRCFLNVIFKSVSLLNKKKQQMSLRGIVSHRVQKMRLDVVPNSKRRRRREQICRFLNVFR